jgi:hypothetical protein
LGNKNYSRNKFICANEDKMPLARHIRAIVRKNVIPEELSLRFRNPEKARAIRVI